MRIIYLNLSGFTKAFILRTVISSFFLLLFVCKGYSAELPQLSSGSLVSLITCSPTSDYEGAFGHSAIRIQDDSLRIDVIFNYGMYDPEQSFFFYKVLLGTLESSLEGEAFYQFAERYRQEGRGIREYYLNLTLQERQQLWEYLNHALLSNDRFYKFGITVNNCSTHMRDVLFEQLKLNTSVYKEIFPGFTLREFELQSPVQNCWIYLLSNLLLGTRADNECSVYQSAFLPDGLVLLLKAVHEKERPLILGQQELFPVARTKEAPARMITVFFFSILFLVSLFLSYRQCRKGRTCILFDRVLFFASGLIGLFFLSIMLFSEIPEFKINYNIAWALPTNIALAFLIKTKLGLAKTVILLARLSFACIACFLLFSFFFQQHIPVEAYLFAVTLLVRLYFYILIKTK